MADIHRDTIAAIATPPGRGGIGIIRLSGPDALAIAAPLLSLTAPLQPNRARFCEIIDPSPDVIAALAPGRSAALMTASNPAAPVKLDEAIVTWYAAPHSYTGEHVLEIAAHGSPVLLDFVLRSLIGRGARLANPGEFTERAFLAGRLDLTQAEAVRDLIAAQTLYQARIAASQLDGALSCRVAPIKLALAQFIARLEAGIDFAEDETPTVSPADFARYAAPIAGELDTLARSYDHGRLVHAGLTLAIVGAPNVGKSSLFNRLVERERAIVTSAPGTTRDLVTERISLAGIPVELVDTAGLRESTDEAERLGIAKSRQALADADLVLLVLEAGPGELPGEGAEPGQPAKLPGTGNFYSAGMGHSRDEILLGSLDPCRSIVVLNKCDLLGATGTVTATLPSGPRRHGHPLQHLQQQQAQIAASLPDAPIVVTSAQTGEGLATLRETIQHKLQMPAQSGQGGMLTNLRQHLAVQSAHAALDAALQASAAQTPDEMLLLDLYTALRHLDTLTGQTTPDDILNLIFSTFCIGK